MKKLDVIRAWKDADYKNSLTESELKSLPKNPAGEILSNAELDNTVGGAVTLTWIDTDGCGWFTTISGEGGGCWGTTGESCNPFSKFGPNHPGSDGLENKPEIKH